MKHKYNSNLYRLGSKDRIKKVKRVLTKFGLIYLTLVSLSLYKDYKINKFIDFLDDGEDYLEDYLSEDELLKIDQEMDVLREILKDKDNYGINELISFYLDISKKFTSNIKELSVFDDIIYNQHFDLNFLLMSNKELYDLTMLGSEYDAYLNNKAVCAGYSEVFCKFLKERGHNIFTISGDGYIIQEDGSKKRTYGHRWVMVEVDGKWYHINPNSDYIDGDKGDIRSLDRFLVSTESFKKAYEKRGFCLEWNEDDYPKAEEDYPRKELLDKFSAVIEQENLDEVTLKNAIHETYGRDLHSDIYYNNYKYMKIDKNNIGLMKYFYAYNKGVNILFDINESDLSYEDYKNIFKKYTHNYFIFTDKVSEDEAEKIQRAYIDTRDICEFNDYKFMYNYDNENIYEAKNDEEYNDLKILLDIEDEDILYKNQVDLTNQVNIVFNKFDMSNAKKKLECLKHLGKLKNVKHIKIINETDIDIFQLEEIKNIELPILYYTYDNGVKYDYISNKVILNVLNIEDIDSMKGQENVYVKDNEQPLECITDIKDLSVSKIDDVINAKDIMSQEEDLFTECIEKLYIDDFKSKESKDIDENYENYENLIECINEYVKEDENILNAYKQLKKYIPMTLYKNECNQFERYINIVINDKLQSIMGEDNIIPIQCDSVACNLVEDGYIYILQEDCSRIIITVEEFKDSVDKWRDKGTNYIYGGLLKDEILKEVEEYEQEID